MANTFVHGDAEESAKLDSGKKLANRMRVAEEEIQRQHEAGRLIAIVRRGRDYSEGFPAFQALPGICGEPLALTLKALGYRGAHQGKGVDAAQAYQFFTGTHELLGGLTPIQILTGECADGTDLEAVEFLGRPYEDRLDFVLSVAEHESLTTLVNLETRC